MSVGRIGTRAVFVAVVCAVGLLAGAGSALAEEAKFAFTEKEQEFKVPAGVTSVHVVAVGGAGGGGEKSASAAGPGGAGSLGAAVSGNLGVTAGETLYVEVGGNGVSATSEVVGTGGFNGGGTSTDGGGGGGASDVRTESRTETKTLESRLLVAAGGGGGGEGDCATGGGGAGGNAEEAGHPGFGCEAFGGGGGAGTSTKGGAGGSTSGFGFAPGNEGALGAGGGGVIGGGAGGGGLYGGGTGGNGFASGGGGGGSNRVPTGGTAKLAEAGKEPSVTITYTVPPSTTLSTSLTGEGKSGENITVQVETPVGDSATLSGENASKAGGTVTYNEYLDSKCEQFFEEIETVTVSSGSVPPRHIEILFSQPANYYFAATYSGDENNAPSTSKCETVTVVPQPKPTTLKTSLSGEGKSGEQITVNFGTQVTDSATLSGEHASAAKGTVTYKLYTDSGCTKLSAIAGEVSVSNGSVPASPPVERNAGTYYWQAEYSGDESSGNEASKSTCGAEVATVARAPTETTTSLSGEGKAGEQIAVKEGTAVTDSATLSTTTTQVEGSLTYSVYSDAGCTKLVKHAGTVVVSGGLAQPSEAQTLSAGTYYWQAEYSGDANNKESSSKCGAEVLTVAHATTTTVKCSPASLVAGGSTLCTATVKDEATSGATTPTGNVTFKTSGAGSFSKASCALAGSGATASCSVLYKPTATPKEPERTDTITAKYEGDETHEATEGSTAVTVISYSQTISGLVNGKLVVKAGQSVLLSSTATVNGTVTIEAGGALDVEGARINGGLTANEATRLRVCGARINGSGVASNGTGKVVIGEGTAGCPGNTINGPVTVTGNSAGVQIVGNTVNGPLTVTGNAGGTTVSNNTINGGLTVTGNTGTVVDTPNTVHGKTQIQISTGSFTIKAPGGEAPPAPPLSPPPTSPLSTGSALAPRLSAPSPPKPLTMAQKRAKALRACGKKPKRERPRCRARAEKVYGPKHIAESHAGRR